MRIVGGAQRGARLVAPAGTDTRPTADRLRESVFNVLAHRLAFDFEGCRVLDLFAGSGALACEALSRGAAFALLVDSAPTARAAIRQNLTAIGALGRAKVWRRDAARLGPASLPPFDLVFADPPYAHALGERALAALLEDGWLAPGAVAVLEERVGLLPPSLPGFEVADRRPSGGSEIAIFVRDPAASAAP